MNFNKLEDYNYNNISDIMKNELDAIFVIDADADLYKTISKKGIFNDMFSDSGNYHDLIEKLWFHFNNSSDAITKDYHVFIPTFGKFKGKYSKRLKILFNETPHIVQMSIYPIENTNNYLLILADLDNSEYIQEFLTYEKVNNIQSTYLFSMYVDLIKDTTSSISVTEISDEPMNATELSYTNWRLMIVNMIFEDDQKLFLERSDPEYLKANLEPGRTTSFDCQMQNLEGKYIWVKLIFNRLETHNKKDFRFVYMVQDIHESSVELFSTLKKYEELASTDTLTGVYNHGRIDTELNNAIETHQEINKPLSLMMIDIDHFKEVNDNFGHSVGDATLKHFVRLAQKTFKQYNIKLGRWGGEEFIAVCYDTTLSEAMEISEQFRIAVANSKFDTVDSITCSIGVTEITDSDDVSTAFERVDKAMYSAKSDGRNCVKSE